MARWYILKMSPQIYDSRNLHFRSLDGDQNGISLWSESTHFMELIRGMITTPPLSLSLSLTLSLALSLSLSPSLSPAHTSTPHSAFPSVSDPAAG